MKKIFTLICLLAFCGIYNPVFAVIEVPSNTIIPINVVKTENSKTVVPGTSIEARIAEDVLINNTLIFKSGDRALLNILSAKKAGFVGIPGEMIISGGKVYDVNGVEHRVDFNQQLTGEEKTWPKVCLGCGVFIILAPLALFGFVKGGQATINPVANIETRIITPFEFETNNL